MKKITVGTFHTNFYVSMFIFVHFILYIYMHIYMWFQLYNISIKYCKNFEHVTVSFS